MRGNKVRKSTGFLERRRARQGDASSKRARAYTFELAALHLRLLAAMAAVDEEVRHVEVEEVLAFLDKTSLRKEEQEKLEQLAKATIAAPPSFESMSAELDKLARKPAIARLVVADLARVAAADQREDPREVRMLETVCDLLKLDRIKIQIDEPAAAGAGAVPHQPSAAPRLVTQHRARAAVRRALEASYRDEGAGS